MPPRLGTGGSSGDDGRRGNDETNEDAPEHEAGFREQTKVVALQNDTRTVQHQGSR
jgi:hypothetical protein